jgi:hypothetical protein
MLFKEIIAVYTEKHTKTMQSYWLLKQVVHVVTNSVFKGLIG